MAAVQSRKRTRVQNAAGATDAALASNIPERLEQAERTARQTVDKIQEAYERAVDVTRATATRLRQRVKRRPIAAVLTAGLLGYTMGRIIHRRR